MAPLHDVPCSGSRLSPAEWFAFDTDDIDRCFPGEVTKARPYQRRGAVRDLRADKGGRRLIASVQGSRPRPYHVFVEIGSADPVKLSAQCSCPVGRNCKHAAAVLLQALENPPRVESASADPLAEPVGEWLQKLSRTALPAASPEVMAYRLDRPPQPGLPFVFDLRVVRILKSGSWGADRPCPIQQLQNATAKYVQPDDRAVLRLLAGGLWSARPPLPEDPDLVDLLLRSRPSSWRKARSRSACSNCSSAKRLSRPGSTKPAAAAPRRSNRPTSSICSSGSAERGVRAPAMPGQTVRRPSKRSIGSKSRSFCRKAWPCSRQKVP